MEAGAALAAASNNSNGLGIIVLMVFAWLMFRKPRGPKDDD